MTGKSTFGTEATGRKRYATIPSRNSPTDNNVVPTGLRMKGSEIENICFQRTANEQLLAGGSASNASTRIRVAPVAFPNESYGWTSAGSKLSRLATPRAMAV